MDAIITIRKLKAQNVNAISGLTWGFPSITNFLGFTHALSRKLKPNSKFKLNGCGVIAHSYGIREQKLGWWNTSVLSQNRFPLKKDGKTASFVEEGKMNIEVTLVISCNFTSYDLEDLFETGTNEGNIKQFIAFLREQIFTLRIAGGDIFSIESITFEDIVSDEDERINQNSKFLKSLLPGFCIIERTQDLNYHFNTLKSNNKESELIDAWLDFIAIKYHAVKDEIDTETNKISWQRISKPSIGWLVPIQIGFKGISNLFDSGEVESARNFNYPFHFVEAVYSIGSWLAPYRLEKIEDLLWHYNYQDNLYLCRNYNPYNHL